MNNKDVESPTKIPWNIRSYDISDLQPEHANSGWSESDLVSDKMKETILYTIIVVQSR